VGPITVAYNGTARISEKDDAARRAVLSADGRETTGPGSARATATMSVIEADGGSKVRLVADYTVAGRVANFGRGVMEDVSRRLVTQMADCIKAHLETSEAPAADEPQAAPAESVEAASATGETAPGPPGSGAAPAEARPPSVPTAPPAQAAQPVNALSLMFSVLWDRVKRLFGAGRPG
jgi:hypothetical protein